MKKIFLLLAYLLLVSNLIFSQSGWFWQNPTPTGNDYECIRFYNENIGYAVGWANTIAKTTNGGNNWFLVNNGVRELIGHGNFAGILRSLHVIDANNVIAAGNGVIRTSNGGLNWSLLSNQFNTLSDMSFADNNNGYVVYMANLYKTTNGGTNWNITYFNESLNSVYFLNSNTGFLGGQLKIFKTTNSGVNWISYSISSYPSSIRFVNSLIGFCASSDDILKTTNGGLNWQLKCTPGYHSGGELSFSNLDTGYYCNWSGNVYKTFDSGETWFCDSIGGLTISLCSPKSNLCVVVGSGGQIYETNNCGSSWSCSSSPFGNLGFLYSLSFPTSITGYIFGEYGQILKSSNSGMNWQLMLFNLPFVPLSSHFLNSDSGFVGGLQGNLEFTMDGGNLWDSVSTPRPILGNVLSVHFLNMNTGFVSGYPGNILKTTNRGINWSQVYNNSGSTIGYIQFPNMQTGYCAMGSGQSLIVLKTTDQGNNWNIVYTHTYQYKLGFQMVNESTGYLSFFGTIGADGIMKTTNGGLNWFQVLAMEGEPGSLYFVDVNTGFTSGGFKTTNGGTNWVNQYVNIMASYLIKDMVFINSNTGFMVGGYGGSILKTTDGGGIGYPIALNSNFSKLPEYFDLLQNYPNPFNPQTKIKFDIPANAKGQTSNVRLVIYDMLGREIATLVNEELKPGTYEADWDASNFSSGVYFYRFVAGDFAETRKMVLMK
jgi:photosystem II stability/assembly factor-like uncharacterized protein